MSAFMSVKGQELQTGALFDKFCVVNSVMMQTARKEVAVIRGSLMWLAVALAHATLAIALGQGGPGPRYVFKPVFFKQLLLEPFKGARV